MIEHGRAVRVCRAALNISRKELAAACRIDQSNLAHLERGGRNRRGSRPATYQRIASGLGMSIEELTTLANSEADETAVGAVLKRLLWGKGGG